MFAGKMFANFLFLMQAQCMKLEYDHHLFAKKININNLLKLIYNLINIIFYIKIIFLKFFNIFFMQI